MGSISGLPNAQVLRLLLKTLSNSTGFSFQPQKLKNNIKNSQQKYHKKLYKSTKKEFFKNAMKVKI